MSKKINDGYGSKFNKIYKSYEKSAIKRKIEFNLDKELFKEYITKDCYYCGDSPKNLYSINNQENFTWNGIDRIDPTKGYLLGNMVTCCSICNRFKLDMQLDYFINFIIKINHNIKNINYG